MRYATGLLCLLVALTTMSFSAYAAHDQGGEVARWGHYPYPPPPPPPPPGATAPIYRFNFNGHHFLTLNYADGTVVPGMYYEGVAFYVWTSQWSPVMIPIFRCFSLSTGDHMASTDVNCEGYNNEGQYGWIFPYAVQGSSTPIYRCFEPAVGDHLTTVNPNECARLGGYVQETQGFVY